MMKNIKKVIVSILVSFMLVTCLQCKPVVAESAKDLASLQEISSRAHEISENLMNLKVLTALDIGGMTKGSCIFRTITSFAKLGMSVLKMSGIFGRQGEDWRITAIKNINNRLSAVDAELGNVNKHLDQIEKSINEQLSAIGSDVKKISTTLAKNNMTDVALVAKQITDKIDSYENTVNSNLIKWYDVNYNPSYSRKINVSYLVNENTGESKTVYMSKELIENALEEAEDWDINRKEELIKTVFVDAIYSALKDNTSKTYRNFNDYCLTVSGHSIAELKADIETKQLSITLDEVIKQFSEAAYDALRYECTKRIAKASVDDANTYASTLVGSFTTYCNYLTEANNLYTSPLKSQYEIYSNIYAFQGELKCTASYTEDGETHTENTNLAAIAKEKYFIELNKIGTFVAEIANASGAYTEEDLYEKIYMPWSTSEAALNQAYSEFYNVDLNGDDIDNFCYVTDSVLKYGINCVDFCMKVGFLTYESSGKRHVDSTTRTIATDWTSTIGNDYILTNNQLSKIYAYFTSKEGKRSGMNFDFYDYLYNYKVCDTKIDQTYDKSPLLITSFNGGADMGSNDRITMIVWPFYLEYNEKYVRQSCGASYEQVNEKGDSDNYTTKFYKEVVTGATGEMVFKRKGIANTFNPLTGEASTNTTVGAAAMHFHDYKTQDDIAMLVSAEYMPTKYMFDDPGRNPKDTAFNYNVSSAQLWKKSWSGSSYIDGKGQERFYGINSRRHYGSIISNDVEVYKTNGKISNTNSYELKQNSNAIVNNYVKNVSFDGNYIVNEAIKNDETIKNSYISASTNAKDKFEKLLEILYPNKQEEIERLKANKVYSISFDNDNCSNVDVKTYKAAVKKLVEYLKPDGDGNNTNITSMISDFRTLYSEMIKTIDVLKAENNEAEIILSDNDYNKLIETIIEENLEDVFSICEKIEDLPKSETKKFIYCKEDGEIYIWKTNIYDKFSKEKEAYTYVEIPNGTTLVSDDIYSSNTIPTSYVSDYIYYSSNNKYYKWNEVEVPEHYGKYEEMANIKVVDSVPSSKENNYLYLYCLANNKFYEWKKGLESKYTQIEDTAIPTISNLEQYVGQIGKYNGDYYKWATTTIEEPVEGSTSTEEIIVDKYVKVDSVNTLPESFDKQYLVYDGNCYEWSTAETDERYIEIESVPQVGNIVDVDSKPSSFVARFIRCKDDNKLYGFKEETYSKTSGYVEASGTVKKVSELGTTTGPDKSIEVNFYPSSSSRQLKLVYEVKPTISFELFFDKEIKNEDDVSNANIGYNVVSYFDITPMLTWKDASGNQKYLTISDDVLKKANIGSISVKIPVLKMDNENDTHVLIHHFDSMEHTSCPIDEYYSRIIVENGAKYAMISTNSFSPFMVKKTYSLVDPSKKYDVPNTNGY